MSDGFSNAYADRTRADAYASLELPGTYYLAFRDIPALIARHVTGARALDFGCGAGRSTRFLGRLGFSVVGADVAAEMLERARAADAQGDYRLVPDGDLGALSAERFDLILCAFTFDNVPTRERKVALFRQLSALLAPRGTIINLVSSADIYTHEWTSFSTKDFPENWTARTGDVVRIVMLDVSDRRPIEDVFWTDEAWRDVYAEAGLRVLETCRPLGTDTDPFPWVSEETVAPWSIYVLERGGDSWSGGHTAAAGAS